MKNEIQQLSIEFNKEIQVYFTNEKKKRYVVKLDSLLWRLQLIRILKWNEGKELPWNSHLKRTISLP